jgi:hypothetical protein
MLVCVGPSVDAYNPRGLLLSKFTSVHGYKSIWLVPIVSRVSRSGSQTVPWEVGYPFQPALSGVPSRVSHSMTALPWSWGFNGRRQMVLSIKSFPCRGGLGVNQGLSCNEQSFLGTKMIDRRLGELLYQLLVSASRLGVGSLSWA